MLKLARRIPYFRSRAGRKAVAAASWQFTELVARRAFAAGREYERTHPGELVS